MAGDRSPSGATTLKIRAMDVFGALGPHWIDCERTKDHVRSEPKHGACRFLTRICALRIASHGASPGLAA